MNSKNKTTQNSVDNFYKVHGDCCAGCDHWRWINSLIGECIKSAPSTASDRIAMIGIKNISADIGSGHVITDRDHLCGDFIDTYDWGDK